MYKIKEIIPDSQQVGAEEKREGYPGIEMSRTGNWLRYVCSCKRISVKKLCECIGLGSPQSIYGWFCGKTLPSLDNFYVLSKVLHMSLDELIINEKEVLPSGFVSKVGQGNKRMLHYWLRFTH